MLRYTILHYTRLNSTKFNYSYNYATLSTLHNTRLYYSTGLYATLHYSTPHVVSLQQHTQHHNYNWSLNCTTTTTPLCYNYNYNCTTTHKIQQIPAVCGRGVHCNHCQHSTNPQLQLQPPVLPSGGFPLITSSRLP